MSQRATSLNWTPPVPRTACPQGHPDTPANTYFRKTAKGGEARQCRVCNVEAVRRYRERKKQRASTEFQDQ